MPLQLLPIEEQDIARIQVIERDAYGPNPSGSILFPGPFPPSAEEARRRKLTEYYRTDPSMRWMKVVDTDLPSESGDGKGRIIAHAKWHCYDPEVLPMNPPTFGEGDNLEACEYVFGRLHQVKDKVLGKNPHMYLAMLATEIQNQRRGAAHMLMKWGTDEADKRKIPAFLEASPEGYRVYLKHGFEVVEEQVNDLSKWGGTEPDTVYGMLRKTRT